MKVILITVAVWLACVVGIGYWYVVVGSLLPAVSAEYERRTDYRLAFFVLTIFPALLVVLVTVLWIEWRSILRKRQPTRYRTP